MHVIFFAFSNLFWAFLLIGTGTLWTVPLAHADAPSLSQAPLQNIRQITLGGGHTCALTSANGVKCWGYNGSGQLGDNATTDKRIPVDVAGLGSGVAMIEANGYHTCALMITGSVKCWGYNNHGQLGDGTFTSKSTPTDVTSVNAGVQGLTAGSYHTCALTVSGGVKCWGYNVFGQLGDNTAGNDKSIPVDVIGLSSGVKAMTAGVYHTCALLTTGSVKCWGGNSFGQLGDGTVVDKHTPVDVVGLGSEIMAIAAGEAHTCALTISGGVKCWGANGGKLGNGTTVDQSTPVDVSGLGSGVQAIAAGRFHTCALLTSSSIRCWGINLFGQLGDGTTVNKSTPVNLTSLGSNMQAIAGGGFHTCALTTIGDIKCWGYNDHGQLGDNAPGNKSTPGDVSGLSSRVKVMTTGGAHTCALTLDGVAKCWGYNGASQLGNSGGITPVDVPGLRGGSLALAAGGSHTCALTSTSGIKCWGSNAYGQLGDGTFVHKGAPVDVIGLSNSIMMVVTGGNHTCALTTTRSVKCWGRNNHGQLGIGATASQYSPVDLISISDSITMLAAGASHTCALTVSAKVKCWGNNEYGQLGDGTTLTQTQPVDVIGLTFDVIAIAAGASHTCALTTSHTVKCWGDNQYGQLGNGTTTREHTPVDIMGLPDDVVQITVGSNHSCALLATGDVRCWGFNGAGQLGDTTTVDKAIPADRVAIDSPVTLFAAGGEHTCALTIIGGLKCWGSNAYGQLGDGAAWRVTPVDVVTRQPLPTCYHLTYTHTGNGDDPVPTPLNSAGCFTGHYVAGATIIVHASPAANWHVVGWQGTVNNGSLSTDNSITMPASDALVSVAYDAVPPAVKGDAYEDDNTCLQAPTLAANGVAQSHTFHQAGDTDWVRFAAEANVPYRITVSIPPGSPADVVLITRNSCDDVPVASYNQTFTPGILTTITRTVTGIVYLQLSNVITTVAGPAVAYQVAVRPLEKSQGQQQALILAAGSLSKNDRLQSNIDNVVKAVYQFYQSNGYSDDDIFFLTNQPMSTRDAAATLANLQAAITDWAKGRLTGDATLLLYLMDHGDPGKFYLDGSARQELTPLLLNTWLDQLQSALPDLKVTIIIEACYSGSFISDDHSISKNKTNRLVLTSTNPESVAYASVAGAYFSDFFLTGLRQGYTIPESFRIAYGVTDELFSQNPTEQRQKPQLDANGNGVANESADVILSTQYHAGYDEPVQIPNQAPYVASVTPPAVITNQRGLLQATVHDDEEVQSVWAMITPPSYRPPGSSAELVPEARPTIVLLEQSKLPATVGYAATFAVEYTGFTETGLYQIAIYATDNKKLTTPPKVIAVWNGSQLFLPLVRS